jgi:hypothetical protein
MRMMTVAAEADADDVDEEWVKRLMMPLMR